MKKNQKHYNQTTYMVHRMEEFLNSIYLEASTSQLKDVVRISDDYEIEENNKCKKSIEFVFQLLVLVKE